MGGCFLYAGQSTEEKENGMFKIAVCDDDSHICEYIKTILIHTDFADSDPVEVNCFFTGEELCENLAEEKYDLLILDIELEKMDGIEVGRFIREKMQNDYIQILYISAKEQYAMDLFENRPLQFLVKPLKKEELTRNVQKAICLCGKKSRAFQFRKENEIYRVPYHEILYFESCNKQVRMKTLHEEYYFYDKLDRVEEYVKNGKFLRVHKSFLVNYWLVKSFSPSTVALINGERLVVSRGFRTAVMEKLMEYSREQL